MSSEIKAAARSLIDALPECSSWEDLQYRIYVRQQIDAGLADEALGRLLEPSEVSQRLEQRKRKILDLPK